LFIKELFPPPAGPVIPIIIDVPVSLKIFFSIFFAPSLSFSIIVIAFAIAPRLPFF